MTYHESLECPTEALSQEALEDLRRLNYMQPRVIDGKICALQYFMTTVGVVIGIDPIGYERRYCFKEFSDAERALNDWDGSGHVSGPWIKGKGRYKGEVLDHNRQNAPK